MGPGYPPRQTGPKAVAALLFGISSLFCLGAVTGLPAIVLGAIARREIDRSGGALSGSGIAALGIVTGLFGTGLGAVTLLVVLGIAVSPLSAPAEVASSEPAGPALAGETRSYGPLDVVDVDERAPLRGQLAEIVRRARASERTVVLQTTVSTNARCAQIDAALPDLRVQHALANVTLVRVDADDFAGELGAMSIETTKAPRFYVLDGSALPTDSIGAEELDASLPENVALVLGRFVRRSRR